MLLQGAFGDITASSVRELIHVRLTGGAIPGEAAVAKLDANQLAAGTLERLSRHIERYANAVQGYRSREMPYRMSDAGDYDHLARVREWSLAVEDEE